MLITGIVDRVVARPSTFGEMWSIAVDNTYYGFKKVKPSCNVGDSVQFQATQNAKGFWDADPKSLAKAEAQQPKAASSPSGNVSTPSTGGTGYNDRQDAISYQSARNAAQTQVDLYLNASAIPFPAKAKESDRKAIIDLYVAKQTEEFFEDTKRLKPAVLSTEKLETVSADSFDDEKLPF